MADEPLGIFYLICHSITGICVFVVLVAVIIDFAVYHNRRGSKKKTKSFVDTGTMLLFFMFFYVVVRYKAGKLDIVPDAAGYLFAATGVVFLVAGCVFNVLGRLALGSNWSNQVRVYEDQTLVRNGVYGFVRHPLYASIIWMFVGASFVYMHPLALCSTVVVFIPFMVYRARQEEKLLSEEFKEYSNYVRSVGMFVPRLSRRRADEI